MPLTVGGGIKSIEDISQALKAGADKVLICSEAIKNPTFIKNAVRIYGSQCIVIGVDIKKKLDGNYIITSNCGNISYPICAFEYLKNVQDLNVGEIVINFVDQDGLMAGYDINFINKIKNINLPIVVAGGCGNYEHMYDALKNNMISAVAAGSIFYFTECTPAEAKVYLKTYLLNLKM